jgi:hypothetical protein
MTVRVAHALGGEREDAQGQGYREYVAHHQNLFALLYTRPPTHLATRECTIAWLGRPAGPAVGKATAVAALARARGGGGGTRLAGRDCPEHSHNHISKNGFQLRVESHRDHQNETAGEDRHPGSVLARRAFARVIAMTSFEFGEWFAFGATACVVVRTLVAGGSGRRTQSQLSGAKSVEWRDPVKLGRGAQPEGGSEWAVMAWITRT